MLSDLPSFVLSPLVALGLWFSLRLTVSSIVGLVPVLLEFAPWSRPPCIAKQVLAGAEAEALRAPSASPAPRGATPGSLANKSRPSEIMCWDPSTLQFLGAVPAMSAADVCAAVARGKAAQRSWARTSFRQRRLVLRTLQRFIVAHVPEITEACSRDSGKPRVDALLGEIMTTCEKIRCINFNGEGWLRPERRPTGPMMVHKDAYVE
jgi:hypothetical protein